MKLNKQHHKCGIYCIRNLVNGKVYIGKAKDIYIRINHHRSSFRSENDTEHNDHFKNAWNKYGEENFEYFVLEYLELDEELLRSREQYWMEFYQSLNPEKGYNLRQDSETNLIVHPCTSEKISKRLKQEWKNGIRKDHGKKLSENWKDNVSRKDAQSKLLSKTLTKFLYNIYDLSENLLFDKVNYQFLKEKDIHNVNYKFFKYKLDKVKFKTFIIERVKIEDIVRHS